MPSQTAAEILEVLDECFKENFKNKEYGYDFSEWERKRNIVKQKLKNLKDYVNAACKTSELPQVKNLGHPVIKTPLVSSGFCRRSLLVSRYICG